MIGSNRELIKRHLGDAIAAEKSFEFQLRDLAGAGDDEEVQSAFSVHADQTRFQLERLSARLNELGGAHSNESFRSAAIINAGPRSSLNSQIPEERVAHNLIWGYTVETGECAMYEALAVIARAAGDVATEHLARQIQTEEREMAARLWHFLPSRSKIAFNMLTVNEIDPSVETKTGENRVLEG